MSTASILNRESPKAHRGPDLLSSLPLYPAAVSPAAVPRRDRIWDLATSLHCSIVGTCLTTGDLRHLFGKLNDPDAKTATDHALHGRAVRAAGQRDVAGKLLHKLLDRRHEAIVRRFGRARTTDEVRTLWRDFLDRGEIPGAYWAVLTHPATDHALVQEVFGDVHMLSHLVGMSNRADIRRLRQLEAELEEMNGKLERQQARLKAMAEERLELIHRLDEAKLPGAESVRPAADADGEDDRRALHAVIAQMRLRLAAEQSRTAHLDGRIEGQAAEIQALKARLDECRDRDSALRQELASLEAAMAPAPPDADPASRSERALSGLTLLYVGGRPRQVDQLRTLASRRGGVLLSHDGGIENSLTLLPGLISQADAALFPVDCISHLAAGQVKRLCGEARKPFLPLRSASVASFLAALDRHEFVPPPAGPDGSA